MKTLTMLADRKLTKHHDTAVVLHLYYPELFDEITQYLDHLNGQFDLYVSLPFEQAGFEETIRQRYPEAAIYLVENRGRDLAPFLELLEIILPMGYQQLLKVHTKKTLHREDGTSWRKDVFEKLIGSKQIVDQVLAAFEADDELAMIGPQDHVLDAAFYMGKNREKVQELLYRCGIAQAVPESFFFVASTMFWVRPNVLEPLLQANLQVEEFEQEPLPNDGGLAHALERLLGLLVQAQGKKIRSMDAAGQLSDPDRFEIYPFATPPAHLHLRNLKSVVSCPTYQEAYAIEHLRITAPLRAAGVEVIVGSFNGMPDPEMAVAGDAVIFQREFPKNVQAYDQIVAKAREAGKFILYEVDDLLFDLPESHPERAQELYNAALMPMLAAIVDADLVIVPTTELRTIVEGYNPNVILLPNYLDDTLWELQKPIVKTDGEALLLGYMGSNSHTPDLAMIAPALRRLLEKYPERLKVEIWGTPLPKELANLEAVSWKASPTNVYCDFAQYFQTLRFDLVIAPLADNLFNRCKSGLKFLEYGAIGAPGVYSRLAPYEAVITDGSDGFLAEGEEEWFQKLSALIEDPRLRSRMAQEAQKTIREKWLLSENIRSWQDIFKGLGRTVYLEDPKKPSRAHLANSVNRQLFFDRVNQKSRQNYLEAQINAMQQDIDSLQNSVRDRDATLDEIYNSRAWKAVTRYREGRAKITQASQPVRKVLKPILRKLPGGEAAQKQSLRDSGLFDADYYLAANPDVRNAGADPLKHYLLFGGIEGRNPSAAFDSRFYLDNNPDVMRTGINPLLHYLRFGKQEGRQIREVGATDQALPAVSTSTSSKTQRSVPERVVLAENLTILLQEKLKEAFQLALSHDDYLSVTGGSQVYIADEQRQTNHFGKSYLQVYPYRRGKTLTENDALLYLGINLDGEPLAETEANEFIKALTSLKGRQFEKLSIHHTMGFSERFLQNVLDLAGKKAVFWLHDFFSLCPSYNLRLNDGPYCGAPPISSDACRICRYIEARGVQMPVFERLFKENQLEIASPSRFTYELWQARFPVQVPGKVIPPAVLRWRWNFPIRNEDGKLKVGFLGYPLDYKGWHTWMRLVKKLDGNESFSFYHFSSQQGEEGNYARIETTVTQENRTAMIDSLRWHRIDVALLWSTVAETFSFTLHEALAAGCYILTNPKSGNIQDYLKRNPDRGMILEDEEALLACFESGELLERVSAYQKDGKPQADLIFGSLKESN